MGQYWLVSAPETLGPREEIWPARQNSGNSSHFDISVGSPAQQAAPMAMEAGIRRAGAHSLRLEVELATPPFLYATSFCPQSNDHSSLVALKCSHCEMEASEVTFGGQKGRSIRWL
ncbi:uncharacterized protein LOC111482768 isoform X1 [Cucurbita maxima]|uniref:Uncharacterized protein LOC111482768 isoform X1 n=1 Tax=Cucurbita maxima TaxID=3661 RepID=A0A6J1JAM1_CUCMA|nr:uncharacterized protein LOC111482768 isoform X1 [Cucurbita maxima]XP_022984480.1 uncharacterized protein LOC111482768 isoform X1 [Cucurbita maxima]